MNEAMSKKAEGRGTQQMPTLAMYAEAMNRFSRSATILPERMHLLTEATLTYHVAVGAALRDSLDAGDQTMRYHMTQLKR